MKLILSTCSKYGVVGDILRGCFSNLISGYNTLDTNPNPAILYFEYDCTKKKLATKYQMIRSGRWKLTSSPDKVQTLQDHCQSKCSAPLA